MAEDTRETMLNIDEDKLKLLLQKRKNMIEKQKYGGIGDIVSGISLAVTLSVSDYSQITFISPVFFKCVAWIITCIILGYGIYQFLKNILMFYTIDNLYSEISDLDPQREHPFDIIVIRDTGKSGRYLTFKSKRWKCWLFPNYHCSDGAFNTSEEKNHIKEYLKRDLHIKEEINITYIGNEINKKYSVGDRVNKKYNFHYFQIEGSQSIGGGRKRFRCNGKKYCWKTLDEMYSSKNTVKKNENVLDYVRKKCDIC